MRLIIWHLFLLVLPFLLYWSYAALLSRIRTSPSGAMREAPVNLLFGSGIGLAILSMVVIGLVGDGADPNSVYRPTRVEDGKLVPGDIVGD